MPGQRRRNRRFGTIDLKARRDMNGLSARESPVRTVGLIDEQNDIVADKIGRTLRRAPAFEIARTGNEDPAYFADAPRDEAGVIEVGDTQRCIDALLDEIDRAV